MNRAVGCLPFLLQTQIIVLFNFKLDSICLGEPVFVYEITEYFLCATNENSWLESEKPSLDRLFKDFYDRLSCKIWNEELLLIDL